MTELANKLCCDQTELAHKIGWTASDVQTVLRSYLEFMSVEDGVIIDREEAYSEVPL